MKQLLHLILPIVLLLAVGCQRDKFAEINTDPSTLPTPELRYSIAKSIEQMFSDDYTVWFYDNFDYLFPWCQLTTSGLGNSENMNEIGQMGYQNIYASLFPNVRDIRHRIDQMPENDKQKRQALKAMTYPILIQPALSLTEKYGALVYTEAALAPYTMPPLITPRYDSQEKLFDIWYEALNKAIVGLSAPNQFAVGAQDVVFGGDYKKWAKFCNLLKLKIAARLVNVNRTKALQIAEEVGASAAGYPDGLSEDFVYRRSVHYQGTGNDTQPGAAAANVVAFLLKNKDPRLRFIFTKNDFNAEVVQTFLDADKPLPAYIEKYVKVSANKQFEGWKAPGEPWVRYFGVPVSPDAALNSDYDAHFKQSRRNKIKIGNVSKTYASTSYYSEFISRTGITFTYPTKPEGRVLVQKDNYPSLYTLLASSAEANLYLAEFKLLGANLPKSAQAYFDQGVRLSVARMDAMAKQNRMPYYNADPVYAEKTMAKKASTKLKAGELEQLLAQADYKLSADALEKVYIQQYINAAMNPSGEIWTVVRRSGIPKFNSKYLAREQFIAGGIRLTIPRRYKIDAPSADNKNYKNQKKAYQAQGFSTGTNDPVTLNRERLWFDAKNPAYGTGSK